MSTTTRRGAPLGTALAGLIGPAIAKAQVVPPLTNPDAELIALCNRLVASDQELLAIYDLRKTKEDEERTEHLLDALYTEQNALIERIQEMPDAATVDGLRAMARGSLSLAPKRVDGSVHFDGGSAEDLAFEIVRILSAGSAVA